ncbi:hypothetical protein OC845_002233 [Tilletia horrida]|nr:hypothetical protein OC845_002233 [Tilletia horrida]
MPKSKFRISKTARHDPLARPSASAAAAVAVAVAGSSKAGSAKSAQPSSASVAAAATSDPTSPAFAVSLLTKLSLPSSTASPTSVLPLTEAIWTLSALGSHIGSKPIRTALLHPDHKLGPRILHALDPATYAHLSGEEDAEDRLAVLTQASGVLRNLCIDAPWGVRDNLGRQGLFRVCISVLQLVIYGQEQEGASGTSATSSSALVQKPADQMNRKEKRHAAKAAAAAAAAAAGDAPSAPALIGSEPDHPAAQPTGPKSSPNPISPDFLAASPHTLALLDNILTLVWCLAESSSDALLSVIDSPHLISSTLDEEHARSQLSSVILADVLLASLQVGLEQTLPPGKIPVSKPNTATGLLRYLVSSPKRKSNPAPGLRQLAISSANALCALTDECPGFVRTLLAIVVAPLSEVESAVATDAQTIIRNLSARRLSNALSHGVEALINSLKASSTEALSPEDHVARTLGALCAAVTRNVIHCASRSKQVLALKPKKSGPSDLSSDSKAGVSGMAFADSSRDTAEIAAAKEVLRQMVAQEQERIVAVLLQYLEVEAEISSGATGWVKLVQSALGSAQNGSEMATDSNEGDTALTVISRRAQERVQTVQLALETLAEVASAASAVASAEDAAEQERTARLDEMDFDEERPREHRNGQANGDGNEDDEDMDFEGLLEEDGESEDGEQDAMETDKPAKAANGNVSDAAPFVFALTSEQRLPSRLLSIARAILAAGSTQIFPSSAGEGSTLSGSDSSIATTLRALVSRSLSAAANALLSVAAESPPTPSEPKYLVDLDWSKLAKSKGKATKERFLVWADSLLLKAGAVTPSGSGGYATLADLWAETWSIATGLAEIPAVAGQTTDSGSKADKEGEEGADGRVCFEACLSILWAISRAFEPVLGYTSSTALFTSDNPSPFRAEPSSTVIPALQAAYLSAQSDSIRVRCLGIMGGLGRVPRFVAGQADSQELVERNRAVGETLLAVLEALPAEGASSSSSVSAGKKKGSAKVANGSSSSSSAATTSKPNLPVTTPECMVAALNAIIDLYADERAVWDVPVFRRSDFLQRLRKLVSRVRAGTRAIDKRTDPSLRARADETAQNYRGFVEFRETVK